MEFVKDVLPEGTPLITIRGKELFGSIEKDATAVLNVGTDISKTFIPEEMRYIASGRIFNIISKRKSVIAFPFTLMNMKWLYQIFVFYCRCSSKWNTDVWTYMSNW